MFLGQSTASSYDSLGITLCTEMNLRFVHNWEIEILRSIISYSSPNFDKRLTQRETFWFLTVTTGCCSQQFLAVSGASNPHHSWPRNNKIWAKPFRRSSSGRLNFSKRLCKTMGCNHVPRRGETIETTWWDMGGCFSFPKRNSWRSKDHGSHGSKNATTVRTPVNPVFTLFEWFMRMSPTGPTAQTPKPPEYLIATSPNFFGGG